MLSYMVLAISFVLLYFKIDIDWKDGRIEVKYIKWVESDEELVFLGTLNLGTGLEDYKVADDQSVEWSQVIQEGRMEPGNSRG